MAFLTPRPITCKTRGTDQYTPAGKKLPVFDGYSYHPAQNPYNSNYGTTLATSNTNRERNILGLERKYVLDSPGCRNFSCVSNIK
jgi:hypothetical protein